MKATKIMNIETFQKNVVEYEHYLSTLYTYEEWGTIPPQDRLIYFAFETLQPTILKRHHRLITSGEEAFRIILNRLEAHGATLGEWMPVECGDVNETAIEEIRAWENPENQESLCSRIKGMKGVTHKTIIFRSSLPDHVIQVIESSPIIEGVYGDTSRRDWFADLDDKLDDLGWAYIPLRYEITPLDFFVASEEYAPNLQEIDRVFEEHGWISQSCLQGENRWLWPVSELTEIPSLG